MRKLVILASLIAMLALPQRVAASVWTDASTSWKSQDDAGLWQVRVVVDYQLRLSSDGPPWFRNIAPTCWIASSFVYKITIQACQANIPTQQNWWTKDGVQQKVGVRYQVCISTAGFFDLYCTVITSYKVISAGRCQNALGQWYTCRVINGPYTEVL